LHALPRQDAESALVYALDDGQSPRATLQGLLPTVRSNLDSHADTIVCGANCTIIHYTGKECDVAPYTDAYESIKSVPIVQAGTAWDNPETGETVILVLNEAIWMADKLEHTLINPNQLRAFGLTVQDNPFSAAPIYIATEDKEDIVPLTCTGTILMASTRTPTNKELSTCRHIVLSSEYAWDPQNVQFPKSTRTVEEEISRTIGSVTAESYRDYEEKESSDAMLLDIGIMSKRIISSAKTRQVPRQGSEVEKQDVSQPYTFQSKGRHSSVTPEDLSERWQIGIAQARETLKRTTQRLKRSAVMPLARRYRADKMFGRKKTFAWYVGIGHNGRSSEVTGWQSIRPSIRQW
jgi:hypothetical protein